MENAIIYLTHKTYPMLQVTKPSSITISHAVESVKIFIDKNPLTRKSTEDFADETGINRNLLQKWFKSTHKKTIKEYQYEKRMGAACEMLKEGRFIKKEISQKCGYDNANNFSNAFKKRYGMSPSQWQKTNCQEHLELPLLL
jgi:two-component system, response regulator YesN